MLLQLNQLWHKSLVSVVSFFGSLKSPTPPANHPPAHLTLTWWYISLWCVYCPPLAGQTPHALGRTVFNLLVHFKLHWCLDSDSGVLQLHLENYQCTTCKWHSCDHLSHSYNWKTQVFQKVKIYPTWHLLRRFLMPECSPLINIFLSSGSCVNSIRPAVESWVLNTQWSQLSFHISPNCRPGLIEQKIHQFWRRVELVNIYGQLS